MPSLLSDAERKRLILEHLRLVHATVNSVRRRNRSIPEDELVSAGYRGLVFASHRFDPNATASFATFAFHRIRGEIQDFLDSAYQHRKLYVVLSEIDPVSRTCQTTTQDLTSSRQEVSPERLTLTAQVLAAVERLPETERTILKEHFFDERPLSDIAIDLGVSKGTMSRLLARALAAIREELHDPLAEWPQEMPKSKTRFSPTFKAQIVRRAQQGGLSISRLARETNVPKTNIREWLKHAAKEKSTSETQLAAA